jgi:hypothetical protein
MYRSNSIFEGFFDFFSLHFGLPCLIISFPSAWVRLQCRLFLVFDRPKIDIGEFLDEYIGPSFAGIDPFSGRLCTNFFSLLFGS